jgi:hypothetical protein
MLASNNERRHLHPLFPSVLFANLDELSNGSGSAASIAQFI